MTGARRGFVTGGTWCCDHNKVVERWPEEDGLAEIVVEERQGGGPGCNLAVDLKRLDPSIPVATIGAVGDDDDGRLLLAEADRFGIDRQQLHVLAGQRTNYTDAFASRASGRRTHIFNQGVGALLSPDHFSFTDSRARTLHLGLPGIHGIMDASWGGEPNGWVAVLRKARAAGLSTNMELAAVAPDAIARLVRPCLPHLDLLVVNDSEIGAIAGLATRRGEDTDVAAVEAAIASVLSSGAMALVAVHFPGGAVVATPDGPATRHPSVDVPASEIAGANGAGDAFAAGLLYGLHEAWPLADAVRLAHATAAASLRSLATTSGVEDWRACLALADRWGWRDAIG